MVGYGYDAAGNMTNDSFHTYAYDAEGNVLTVDGGATAFYTYDALNRRTQSREGSANAVDYSLNLSGQRNSSCDATRR